MFVQFHEEPKMVTLRTINPSIHTSENDSD